MSAPHSHSHGRSVWSQEFGAHEIARLGMTEKIWVQADEFHPFSINYLANAVVVLQSVCPSMLN
eukprot:scaffold30026_cov53-Attheya_sp.AAC.3